MKLNELFVKKDSIINKDIVINNTKCTLVYLKSLIGRSPSEVFSIIKEDSPIACIKIEDTHFTMSCEKVVVEGKCVYIFDVYVDLESGDNYARSEFISEIISRPIKNESELIATIKDLMDYVYFK